MDNYLIQFRFQGKAKEAIREIIYKVVDDCEINKPKPSRVVPHITFVGPFYTMDEQRLINDFYNLCSENIFMHFEINGFNTFEENHVVYLHVEPDRGMIKFRQLLSKTLQPYCSLAPNDHIGNFSFHSTIAMKLSAKEFNLVKSYLIQNEKFKLKHVIARITLLKNKMILREYDFFQEKMLDRTHAKNKLIYSTTIKLLQNYLNK